MLSAIVGRQFEQRLKAVQMQIGTVSRTQNRRSRYGYSSVCGMIDNTNQTVRINTLNSWIAIGICQIRHSIIRIELLLLSLLRAGWSTILTVALFGIIIIMKSTAQQQK
jgi:hypothetical protein